MDNILPRKEILGIDITICLSGKVKNTEIWSNLVMGDDIEKIRNFVEENKHGLKILYAELKIAEVFTLTGYLNEAKEQWEKQYGSVQRI